MATKREEITYSMLTREISRGIFRAVYLLMGEEAFYIDDLERKVTEAALNEDERDFNLTIVYGQDTDGASVAASCRRYPVMAERQVVVLREAQNVSNPDAIAAYVRHITPTTILIICSKGGNYKSQEAIKAMKNEERCVVFESNRLTDANAAKVIEQFARDHGAAIDAKATAMMRDYVGTDVSRLVNEMGKLIILLKPGESITPEMIERNIGISKDFNNFELERALRSRNAAKAFQIIDYFAKNPRKNPTVLTVSLLFSFFSQLLLACTCRNRTEQGLMEQLETRSPYKARGFIEAMRYYNTAQCVETISNLRDFDRKMKGIGSRQNEYELLRELVSKILYC